MRDPQKKRVYSAESDFLSRHGISTYDITVLQQWANEISRTPSWMRRTPSLNGVVVRLSEKKYSQALMNGLIIELGVDGRNELTVLHEMAHILHIRMNRKEQDHGPEYMRILLDLWEDWADPVLFKDWLQLILREEVRISPSPILQLS